MRTLIDVGGVVWICLELPDAPAPGVVAVECNSGADRIVITVAPGWDDSASDADLLSAIHQARAAA